MIMHDFKFIPKHKPKIHIISGGIVDDGKFKYHCKNCDSTLELAEKISEMEINRFFTDPANNFPCLTTNKKV